MLITTRRDFIKVGSIGFGSLFLTPSFATSDLKTIKNKTVVWLWLGGGPTQVETFDPKPFEASEFQSVTGFIPTSIPDYYVGGLFQNVAEHAKDMIFFNSFAHKNSGHSGGTHWVMTGYDNGKVDNGGSQSAPSIGSVVSRYYGLSPNGIPNYVKLNKIDHEGPSWLGANYGPFDSKGEARRNLDLSIDVKRLDYRKELLGKIDKLKSEIDATKQLDSVDKFKEESFKMLDSKISSAFDITLESQDLINDYGSTREVGKHLLMARRLAERGAKFITINYGGWDNHQNIKTAMESLVPPLDKAIGAFIKDVKSRGLENDILLVITGDFGRTLINKDGGRDHWPSLSTLALFGGGFKNGQVIGKSDKKAMNPITDPVTPENLMFTIFNFMGLPKDLQYFDHSGRPTYMLPNNARLITEIV